MAKEAKKCIPYKGSLISVSEAARITGLRICTVMQRIEKWGHVAEVVTVPRGGIYRKGGGKQHLHPWRTPFENNERKDNDNR